MSDGSHEDHGAPLTVAEMETIESSGFQNSVVAGGFAALLMIPVAWSLVVLKRLWARRTA